jgi:hypothetical protein
VWSPSLRLLNLSGYAARGSEFLFQGICSAELRARRWLAAWQRVVLEAIFASAFLFSLRGDLLDEERSVIAWWCAG